MAAVLLIIISALWYWFSFKVAMIAAVPCIVVFALIAEYSTDDSGAATAEQPTRPVRGPRTKRFNKVGFPAPALLRITYEDAKGETTVRDIEVRTYVDTSPGEIHAHCRLAGAPRTFKTHRVKQAIDLDTGEIVKRLPTYFRSRRSSEHSTDQR